MTSKVCFHSCSYPIADLRLEIPADKVSLDEVEYWTRTTALPLFNLLKETTCSSEIQKDYATFYVERIIPLLGPTPARFRRLVAKPCSFTSDDHTPMEINWFIDADGQSTLQYAMDPLSPSDGAPAHLEDCTRLVDSMKDLQCVREFDNTWNQICRETMGYEIKEVKGGRIANHFFIGGSFLPTGMKVKVFYVPTARAQVDGCANEQVVANCVRRLGIKTWDEKILKYFDSLPAARSRPIPVLVSVDCVQPSQNRVKIYCRCFDRTLNELLDRLTLGGQLTDETTNNMLEGFKEFWFFLFPGLGPDEPVPIGDPARPSWLGFMVYYELRLDGSITLKVSTPVRYYCRNDNQVVQALQDYLKHKGLEIGDRYASLVKEQFTHRDFATRTGIHHYIGFRWKKTGPQISIYLSPEVFAPERDENN